MLEDFLEDLFNHAFANDDQVLVELVTLHQEHVHSNLEGSDSVDLVNCVLVHLDLGNEIWPLWVGIFELFLEATLFFKQEAELFKDILCLVSHFEVIEQNSLDLFFSVDDKFVVSLDIPEVHLLRVCNLSVSSWNLVDSLYHSLDDLDELILNLVERVCEDDLVGLRGVLLANLKLESEECHLKLLIGAVITLGNLLRKRVVAIIPLESVEEGDVLLDRLGGEFTDLVAHECCN